MTSIKVAAALALVLGATSAALAQSGSYYDGPGPYVPGYHFYDSGAPYGYGSGYYYDNGYGYGYDNGYGADAYRMQPSPRSGVESTR